VVVLVADFCAYSSYVRDTRDDRVIRESLTAFASKTRYRIINDGGMLYQFQGDTVIGFFGIPARGAHDASRALACARGLLDIGASVAEQWQRQIDRVQPAAGVHVAMALGDVQMLSLRPFSRAHIGAVAEAVNLSARLIDISGPGEIVISNTLYQALPSAEQGESWPSHQSRIAQRSRRARRGPSPSRRLTSVSSTSTTSTVTAGSTGASSCSGLPF
jgi:adenylate cyclase